MDFATYSGQMLRYYDNPSNDARKTHEARWARHYRKIFQTPGNWLRELAGLCETQLRDMDSAINAWQTLLNLDPSDEAPRSQLRRLLEKAQRWDDLTVLFDVGFNAKKESPSPLVRNMNVLGVSRDEIDAVFISHPHADHTGGIKSSRAKTFELTPGDPDPLAVDAYVPSEMTHDSARVEVVTGARRLAAGVWSIGPIARSLWLVGLTQEPALAVNVAGKGLLAAVELVEDRATKKNFAGDKKVAPRIQAEMMKRGVVTRTRPSPGPHPAPGDSVYFAPPLVVTAAEIDRLVSVTRDAIKVVLGA